MHAGKNTAGQFTVDAYPVSDPAPYFSIAAKISSGSPSDGVAISASGAQAYVEACMNFTPLPVTSRGIDMFFGFQQHSVAYFCVASSEATRQQTRLSGVCTLFRVSVIPVFYPGGYRGIQKAHTTVPCAHACSGQGHQQQPPRKTQCRSQMLLNRFCLDEE